MSRLTWTFFFTPKHPQAKCNISRLISDIRLTLWGWIPWDANGRCTGQCFPLLGVDGPFFFCGAQSSVLAISLWRVEVIVELTLDSVHECAMMVLWVVFGDADDSDYFDGISPLMHFMKQVLSECMSLFRKNVEISNEFNQSTGGSLPFLLMTTPNVLKLLVYFPLLQWQYISCDLFPHTQ